MQNLVDKLRRRLFTSRLPKQFFDWKARVDQSLIHHSNEIAEKERQLTVLNSELARVRNLAGLTFLHMIEGIENLSIDAKAAFQELKDADSFSLYARHGEISLVLPQESELPIGRGSFSPTVISKLDILSTSFKVVRGNGITVELSKEFSPSTLRKLIEACLLVCQTDNEQKNTSTETRLSSNQLKKIAEEPLLAAHTAVQLDQASPPYNTPEELPPLIPAEPLRRSVLFPRHCYYNFYYLARALRARGWDAVSLSTDGGESDTSKFAHGEDLTIYDPDPAIHEKLLRDFYKQIPERFGIVHTYGVFGLPILPTAQPDRPWDIAELKRHRTLIGYSHSGCNDGIRQSIFQTWSNDMCSQCSWQEVPAVCSNDRNVRWGELVSSWVDLFCTETDPAIDFKAASNVFRAPLTLAVCDEFWRPDLKIPPEMQIEKEPGELLIYHSVGNYKRRLRGEKNAKGTSYILAAIERLREEGYPVRLNFFENLPSKQNRFAQLQSDIIVDQLLYGRYGALAREGMMLGKPVVGRVNKEDAPNVPATKCIMETPIIHATSDSIYDVLKHLVENPQERDQIGKKSRAHAVEWWAADCLAIRFEKVYDYLREHGSVPPESFLENQ